MEESITNAVAQVWEHQVSPAKTLLKKFIMTNSWDKGISLGQFYRKFSLIPLEKDPKC